MTGPTATASTSTSSEHLMGLRVLHEPREMTTIVSVVFVHGLGGSATETWTHHPSNTFWPTLLHEDDEFANVRVSTFGYDASFGNIFAPKNTLDISDFAKQLLDALDLHYDKYGDVSTLRAFN
jgi:pimeloyl-ACP methyl ester carboxylesterase